MGQERDHEHSPLEDEGALLWGFLEDEVDACAVVSSRMEFVYLNRPARQLVPEEWFAKGGAIPASPECMGGPKAE